MNHPDGYVSPSGNGEKPRHYILYIEGDKKMSRYDVNNANANRLVKFRIDTGAAGNLGLIKGTSSFYPHYDQLTTIPTAVQEIAQLRVNALVRAVSVYTVPVGVEVDSTGQWVDVSFEVAREGEYYDNASATYSSGDITDTLGVGGMATVKTKDGLQTLATNALATTEGTNGASGVTLFSANPTLADGTTTTGVAAVSTVTVTYVSQ